MDLMAMETRRRLQAMKLTAVHDCSGGRWTSEETSRLMEGLHVGALYTHPRFPADLILEGHFSFEDVQRVVGTNPVITVNQVTGVLNPDLPFRPPL